MMNICGVFTDRINVWGWPWHGLIRPAANPSQGEIVLPNGQTREHPLTGSTNYRIYVPGTPEVVRSPEQLAADQAAGRQWWNEAILSGTSLYGKGLGGWLYCSPDGSRWIIDLAGGQARRMGEVGKPPQTKAMAVSWPVDNGQSTPSLDFGEGELPYSQWPVPIDIRSDGRAAILMLYVRDVAYGPLERPMPVGFLLVEVTGGASTPFAANVTVLYTRAETLGTSGYTSDLVVEHGTSGPISAQGTETREIIDRIWAAWFNESGLPIPCLLYRREEAEQHMTVDGGTKRSRFLWRLKVAETQACEVDLASLFNESPPGTVTASGTLNGETIYSRTFSGEESPVDAVGPLTLRERLMPRDSIGGVLAGDHADIVAFSNNLIGLYVSLQETGASQTVHRYIGAACPTTPLGPLVMNESHQAAIVTFPDRNKLYGPRPYCAWNPVTHEASALSAGIVGWI